jgi:homeobox-leucine zipper protein
MFVVLTYFDFKPAYLGQDGVPSGRTLDLASSLEVGSTTQQASADASQDECNLRSVLTIAFQFPYEMHLQDSVATMARQYVRSIVSAVQRISLTISPSGSGLNTGQKIMSGFPEAATLVHWICQSYQYVHLLFSIHSKFLTVWGYVLCYFRYKFFSNLINVLYMCRYHLGLELVHHSDEAGESLLRMFWGHPDAVLCCSFKVVLS